MLPSIENAEDANTKVLSKREVKKGINIRSNSGLFFQIGLVVSLLLAIIIINTDFKITNEMAYVPDRELDLDEVRMVDWEVEVPKLEQPKQLVEVFKPKVRKIITSVIEPIDDKSLMVESPILPTEPKKNAVPVQPIIKNTTLDTTGPENVLTVDLVPTFPGCESFTSNDERLACLSSKLHAFIGRKFDTGKYSEKYAGKTNRISVQFTIDATGNVVDIIARAPGDDLEAEAKKVIAKLPTMQPGQKNDKNVPVVYRIPIIFKSDY